jgi:hypothetical protein
MDYHWNLEGWLQLLLKLVVLGWFGDGCWLELYILNLTIFFEAGWVGCLILF